MTDGVTHALKKHLKNKHREIEKDVEMRTKKKKEERVIEKEERDVKRLRIGIGTSGSGFPKGQPSIKSFVEKVTKYDPDGGIQEAYDRALVELLSCNLLSFNLVDSPEFHKFVTLLDKRVNLKSRVTYSRYTEQYSNEILEQVKDLIKEFSDASLSVTTDIWTSRTRDSYLSLTCHFIDRMFRIHRWTPAVALFNESHTGENIQAALESLIQDKLGVDLESKPLFATSDNAANMQKGIRLSMLEVYGCVCHWQQLAILDTFKEFKDEEEFYTLEDASDKCKDLASNLHQGTVGKMLLETECKKNGHAAKVIHQANDTRWDSRLQNMKDVVYHEKCLLSLAANGKLRVKKRGEQPRSLVPTHEEFKMIRGGVQVLQHCQTFTKIMEQEKTPTMPLVVQSLYDMQEEMKNVKDDLNTDEVTTEFCTLLMQKIFQERFPDYGTGKDLAAMGNYLNPTCQGIHLKLVKKFDQTKDTIEENLSVWKGEKNDEDEVLMNVEESNVGRTC